MKMSATYPLKMSLEMLQHNHPLIIPLGFFVSAALLHQLSEFMSLHHFLC